MDYPALLEHKLKVLFPDKRERKTVYSILESYGDEDYEREAGRVRLAILKLSADDMENVQKHTKMAKQDYRDVLFWAEFPRQSKTWSMPEGEKKRRLIKADEDEYEAWLSEQS